MPKKRNEVPSMAEIAAELGLSRSTVSSVINGRYVKARIAPETVQLVQDQLARRGYVPSRHAVGLRSSQKRTIGILHVDDIGSHLVQAFNLLTKHFGAGSLPLELMVTPHHRIVESIRELVSRRVTDLIWIHNSRSGEEYRNPEIANYLQHMRPVIYNYIYDSPFGEQSLIEQGLSVVGVNRTEGRLKMARFLYRLGHRRIAFPDIGTDGIDFMYRHTFGKVGFDIVDCPQPFLAQEFIKIMKSEKITTAHFNGDSPACRAICSLRALGISVPDDLCVTGFDGTSRAFFIDLTTLEMPVQSMVQQTIDIVEGRASSGSYRFDLNLIKSYTHGAPKCAVKT